MFSCPHETFHVKFSSILAKIYQVSVLSAAWDNSQAIRKDFRSLFHLSLTQLVSRKFAMLLYWLLCNADPKHHKHTNQTVCEYSKPGREVIMLWTDQKRFFIVQLRILQFKRN